jgi:hypothetical protein
MGRRGAARALVVAPVALTAALLAPAPASAATAVTMFSDPGDYIGGGVQRLFTPRGGKVTVGGNRKGLSIGVSGGPSGDYFTLEFAPPPGKRLRRGVYDHAQRAPFREAGHPGIDISGSGRGCNEQAGRFQVRDLAVKNKRVKRLWLVYEQHCEGGRAALFGEVRYRKGKTTFPAIVRWPAGESGGTGTAVPVTIRPTRTVHFTSTQITGEKVFPIRLDECKGRTVAAGSSCQVWLRFKAGGGTHRGRLVVSGGSQSYGAELQGFNWGGTTKLVMHSDDGDYIGGGQDWSYTPANASIGVSGTRQHVGFGIDGAGGDWWYGDFSAPSGDILAAGNTYNGAARDAFRGSSPGLDVSGNGRGCNTISGKFTVTEARFEPSGALHSFNVRFEQHCEGADPALRGEFSYRAGDRAKPPPWMKP